MYNRLQHFVEYGIRQLEENQKNFYGELLPFGRICGSGETGHVRIRL